jgi:hypothetical protein
MPEIDVDRLKSWLSEHKERPSHLALHRPRLRPPRQRSAEERAIAQMIEDALKSAGVDIAKLGKLREKLRAEERNEALRIFERERAEIAKHRAEMDAAYRQGIEGRRAALKLLKNPFLTYFADLDTPALILQTGTAGDFPTAIFIDRHIESMNSWVKVLVDTNDNSATTDFNFYFLWRNDTAQPAGIVNASTSLVFNGACRVEAAGGTGLFSGDADYANVGGQLTLWRWSGWGNDPITGQIIDETQVAGLQGTLSGSVVGLQVPGGGLFGNEGFDPKTGPQQLNNQALDLNAGPLYVPAGAEVLFQVAMTLQYGFTAGGGDISDLIFVDFANNESGYLVRCPGVLLEVSGPVPPDA